MTPEAHCQATRGVVEAAVHSAAAVVAQLIHQVGQVVVVDSMAAVVPAAELLVPQ